MFEREALIAARLHHANVVQTHRVGCWDGRHFLAMEYLDGEPLSRVLRALQDNDQRLSDILAVRIAVDALDGLHYAHELTDFDGRWLALVHRDVSPHNIFITMDGHVKVLDFGIAKASVCEDATQLGVVKGKLSYIAPEQLHGESADRRADVWSMGVTLWECLAGRRLFRGQSEADSLRTSLVEPIPCLSEVAPHVADELSAIVAKALTRRCEDRYETALEMKIALEDWLASQSVTAARLTLSGMMRSMFSHEVVRRRIALCACLEKLDSNEPTPEGPPEPVSKPIPGIMERASAPLPYRSAFMVGMSAAVLVAGGVAMVGRSIHARGADNGTANSSLSMAAALPPQENPPRETGAALPGDKAPPTTPTVISAAPASPERPSQRGPKLAPVAATPRPAQRPIALAPAEQEERPARLHLDSTPFAIVMEGEKRLGITPLDVQLSAGTHLLTLRNPELGVQTNYRITLNEGADVVRRISLD
jgi:serine/threonine-protein kinase